MQILNHSQIGSLSLGRGLGGRRSDEGRIQHKTKARHRMLFTTQNNERKLE